MSGYGSACYGIEARADESNPVVCGRCYHAKTSKDIDRLGKELGWSLVSMGLRLSG